MTLTPNDVFFCVVFLFLHLLLILSSSSVFFFFLFLCLVPSSHPCPVLFPVSPVIILFLFLLLFFLLSLLVCTISSIPPLSVSVPLTTHLIPLPPLPYSPPISVPLPFLSVPTPPQFLLPPPFPNHTLIPNNQLILTLLKCDCEMTGKCLVNSTELFVKAYIDIPDYIVQATYTLQHWSISDNSMQ